MSITCVLMLFMVFPGLSPMPQDPPAKAAPRVRSLEEGVHGAFGVRESGVGLVVAEGCLFVEAIVIHKDVVESGIFYLDTRTPTGCVMETHFAKKMKVMGLGNVTLKLGDREIKFVKATSLDHPNLQQIFKKNPTLFGSRPISGIIGYPALSAQRAVFDLKHFILRFLPPAEEAVEGAEKPPSPEVPGRFTVPLRDDMKTLWVEISLNDKVEGLFHLSTGSAYSWIRKEVADKAGLRKGKNPRILKVGGVEMPAIFFNPRITKDGPKYETAPFPVAGCLGLDFFRPFKVTLDGPGKRLILDPLK